jgi:hypothetical protein
MILVRLKRRTGVVVSVCIWKMVVLFVERYVEVLSVWVSELMILGPWGGGDIL